MANTEEWNGTSWTEVSDVNTARYNAGGDGSTTSALGFGGEGVSSTAQKNGTQVKIGALGNKR